jgi:small-conductance mechanosensitive channel
MERTQYSFFGLLLAVLEKLILPVLYVALAYSCLNTLKLSTNFRKYMDNTMMVAVVFFVIRILILLLKKAIVGYVKRTSKEEDVTQINGLLIMVNIVAWALGLIFLMGNLGYNITTIIAGLGVGGIAIALAAQAVLGDFFGYFVIFFDRPFDIGDYIKIDNLAGTVEHMGLKTVRVRALGGEELIFSNTDVTKARVFNYSRMTYRRISFNLGVDKSTPIEKLEFVSKRVKEIIQKNQQVELLYGNLTSISTTEFVFTFVYRMQNTNYDVYTDVQEAFLMEIIQMLQENNIVLSDTTKIITSS